MAKGIVDFKIKVDSKGAVKDIKLMGGAMKKSAKEQTNWFKAGALASAGAKTLDAAIGLLKKGFMALTGPIKDSIFEIGTLGDRIAKQARMIGVTAEEFQVLEFAAKRSGTSVTAVANGMKKLGRVMVDAANGSRQIKDTFGALDIELKKDDGTLRDTFDVFTELADKSMILGESAERTGVQMLLLGRSGTELSNMMSQGGAGIVGMKDELVALGAVMDETQTAAGEDFVDTMANLEHAFRGVKMRIGKELLPEFTNWVAEFTKWTAQADFTKVKELALDFMDAAIGMARWADEIFDLQLFNPTEAENLTKVMNSTEELTERLRTGTATLEDYYRATEGVGASAEVTNGSLMQWQASMQGQNIDLRDMVSNMDELGKISAPAFNATVLKMNKNIQLSAWQIQQFTRNYRTLDMTLEDAANTMVSMKQATGEQAQMMMLLAQSTLENWDATELLTAAQEGNIDAMAEQERREKERRDMIRRNRRATRHRIASLGLEREESDKSSRATDGKSAAERALAAQLKKSIKIAEDYLKAWADIRGEFGRANTDRDLFMEELEEGKIGIGQFMAKMERAETQLVKDEVEERTEILTQFQEAQKKFLEDQKARVEAVKAGTKARADAEAELEAKKLQDLVNTKDIELEIERDAEEQKRAYAQETADFLAQLAFDKMQRERELAAQTLSGASQLFGALGQIAQAAAARGDKKAAAAAKALFMVQQSLALGSAIVTTAQSVSAALAGPPPVPYSIPAGIAAGVMGAAQIATIVGTTISGVADAGLTSDVLRSAGLNRHTAIAVRNDETILDPVGTRHITEMLELQKMQMEGGAVEQSSTTVLEIDGHVLGEVVDRRLVRQAERGLQYSNDIRQQYEAI